MTSREASRDARRALEGSSHTRFRVTRSRLRVNSPPFCALLPPPHPFPPSRRAAALTAPQDLDAAFAAAVAVADDGRSSLSPEASLRLYRLLRAGAGKGLYVGSAIDPTRVEDFKTKLNGDRTHSTHFALHVFFTCGALGLSWCRCRRPGCAPPCFQASPHASCSLLPPCPHIAPLHPLAPPCTPCTPRRSGVDGQLAELARKRLEDQQRAKAKVPFSFAEKRRRKVQRVLGTFLRRAGLQGYTERLAALG